MREKLRHISAVGDTQCGARREEAGCAHRASQSMFRPLSKICGSFVALCSLMEKVILPLLARHCLIFRLSVAFSEMMMASSVKTILPVPLMSPFFLRVAISDLHMICRCDTEQYKS